MAENTQFSKNVPKETFRPSEYEDEMQLSLTQVGEWLGMHAKTVRRALIDTGILPCVPAGSRTRVAAGDVRAYLLRERSTAKTRERAVANSKLKKRN